MAVLIGTSGFGYEEWRGVFYPPDLARADYLRYYSLFFRFVELEFSYVRMPEFWKLERMAESTPSDFRFSIAAHRSLTNGVHPLWPTLVVQFRQALQSRAFRSRLAGVLLSFPHRFRYEDENRVYLGELCSELREFPLFIEFRNRDWLNERVFEEADKRRIGIVVNDSSRIPGAESPRLFGNAENAYVRLYRSGRTERESSFLDVADSRSFSDAELDSWANAIHEKETSTDTIFIALGAAGGGQAVGDAKRLQERLDSLRPRLESLPKAP